MFVVSTILFYTVNVKHCYFHLIFYHIPLVIILVWCLLLLFCFVFLGGLLFCFFCFCVFKCLLGFIYLFIFVGESVLIYKLFSMWPLLFKTWNVIVDVCAQNYAYIIVHNLFLFTSQVWMLFKNICIFVCLLLFYFFALFTFVLCYRFLLF